MNTSEGLRRTAQVVRWIGVGLATIIVIGGIATGVAQVRSSYTMSGDDWIGGTFAFAIGSAFVFFSAKAVAWIIEGFAKEK